MTDPVPSDGRVTVAEPMMRKRKPNSRESIMLRSARASATKLAKRIAICCRKCGKEFKLKPSRKDAKYCSMACRRIHQPGQPHSRVVDKTCVQCGGAFQTSKRAAKNLTCSVACARAWHGAKMKEKGYSPLNWRDEAKWLKSVRSPESREKRVKGLTGLVRTTPKSKRHSPDHVRAVECFLRSPNNVVYYARNLVRFVHEHPELFLPESLNWHRTKQSASVTCNAANGLSTIYRGFRKTWRGWQIVGDREGRERFDLIARNQ